MLVKQDMKNLTVWLNANKISLNVEKTLPVISKHHRKKLDNEIKITHNRKRVYPSQSVRYLRIKIDQNLNWNDHIKGTAIKLNRANALLFKMRNFLNITILKTIYFVLCNCHINYANLVWAQNSNAMSRILTLQKKKNYDNYYFPIKELPFKSFNDKVLPENVLLISKFINSLLSLFFNKWLTF